MSWRAITSTCFRSRSRDKPPQLPPRDNNIYSTGNNVWNIPNNADSNKKAEKNDKKGGDDPYYFGLSARIPNFVKSRKKKQKERDAARARSAPAQVSC